MFHIESIFAGWFKFSICDSNNAYDISYLSNVKEDLDYVFNLKHEESKHITLEMESLGDLLIQTYRDYDHFVISIIELHTDRANHDTFRLNYIDFIKDYISEFEAYKTLYLKEFDYMNFYEDFVWDSEDYLTLKNVK